MSRLFMVTYLISFAFLNLVEVLAQRPLELDPDKGKVEGTQTYSNPTVMQGIQWSVVRKKEGDTQTLTRVLRTLSGGHYQALAQEEEKSIRVDAQTTRIIRTTSKFNHENERQIIEVVEEDHRKLPGGAEHVSRTVSIPDIYGRYSVIRREVQTTLVTGLGVQETNTTVFKPDINGGFGPVHQIEHTKREQGPGTIETEGISKIRDAKGNWVPYERQTVTIREASDQSRREEEEIYRKDHSTGRLTLSEQVYRTYNRSSEGSEQWIIDTHRKNIDGRLHLYRRVRIVRESLPGGRERTVQEVEERNPVAPNDGLRIVERTVTTSRPTGNGENELETEVKALGGNGKLRTLLTRKARVSDQ
jgi:hypothetical protein